MELLLEAPKALDRVKGPFGERGETLVWQDGFVDGTSCGSRLTTATVRVSAERLEFAGRIEVDSLRRPRLASENLYETSRLR
jgi:hypothetical protein